MIYRYNLDPDRTRESETTMDDNSSSSEKIHDKNIFDLPTEIHRVILTFIHPLDCIRLSSTCSKLRSLRNDLKLMYPHLVSYLEAKETLKKKEIRARTNVRSRERKLQKIIDIIIPELVRDIISKYPTDMFNLNCDIKYSCNISMDKDQKIAGMKAILIYYAYNQKETKEKIISAMVQSFRNNLIKVQRIFCNSKSTGFTIIIKNRK